MFAKPFTFLLVFFLALINFIILLIPLSLLFFPLFFLFKTFIIKTGPGLFFFMVSRISGLMIVYIVFDTMFGITMRRMRKGCIEFSKATSVAGQDEIMEAFLWLKKKFNINDVKLYLNPSFREINAYAIGSFSGSTITVTTGLINRMHEKSSSHGEYIDAMRGILGHEMSHLANKDFLPGLLTSASGIASKFVSKIIRIIFVILATSLRIIPWIGRPISKLLILLYNCINYLIMAFYNLIFMPIYNFLLKFFGRAIEYRCDRESAYAYGGQKMAKALQLLGPSGYFSLFSTHPTTNSRIKKLQHALPQSGNIRPNIMNMLANFLSILLVVFICVYSASLVNTPNLYQDFIIEVYNPLKYKQVQYHSEIMQIYNKIKSMLGN